MGYGGLEVDSAMLPPLDVASAEQGGGASIAGMRVSNGLILTPLSPLSGERAS